MRGVRPAAHLAQEVGAMLGRGHHLLQELQRGEEEEKRAENGADDRDDDDDARSGGDDGGGASDAEEEIGGPDGARDARREQRKAAKKAAKAEKRATRGGGDGLDAKGGLADDGRKACDGCGARVDLLIRCQTDATRAWTMRCGKCWKVALCPTGTRTIPTTGTGDCGRTGVPFDA